MLRINFCFKTEQLILQRLNKSCQYMNIHNSSYFITSLLYIYDTLSDICLGSWTLDLNGDVFFSAWSPGPIPIYMWILFWGLNNKYILEARTRHTEWMMGLMTPGWGEDAGCSVTRDQHCLDLILIDGFNLLWTAIQLRIIISNGAIHLSPDIWRRDAAPYLSQIYPK